MSTNRQTGTTEKSNFSFCSSIADDVWHPSDEHSAYEWWYFDAVSDDGRDALTIIFLDNFIFSPRYNKLSAQKTKDEKQETKDTFPAIAFCRISRLKPVRACKSAKVKPCSFAVSR